MVVFWWFSYCVVVGFACLPLVVAFDCRSLPPWVKLEFRWCGVVSIVGINFGGCGLLLVVASDGYLTVICYVDWDLVVILKFSIIKFV